MKLLVFDVEGTLFRTTIKLPGTSLDSTIWQSLANALGPGAIAEEIGTHLKWKNGEYFSYLEWMKDTIAIHRRYKLTKDLFEAVINNAEYNDGVIDTIRQIDRRKYEIIVISGGFRELAARAQKDLNIIHAFAGCEYLFNSLGNLCGYNLLPCDFNGKIDFIRLMLREYKIDDQDWIFIGDGANDIPIAQQAPVAVGYRPHPNLESAVQYSINDFSELLKLL